MVDDKRKTEELFAAWLAKNVPSAKLSELRQCYSEIEAYCLKTKVLSKPLFETADEDTVSKVQKAVTKSLLFRLTHRKQMKEIAAAAQYYSDFVKALNKKRIADIYENIPAVSSDEKPDAPALLQEVSLSEDVDHANKLKIDFLHINNLAYTKPVSFAYFGDEQTDIATWKQLYVAVLGCLSEDYPTEFSRMCSTNISGGRRIDFGTQEMSKGMSSPKKVHDNLYAETNLSATDIVTKLRIILDRCNVDYENLEIYYMKPQESAQRTANVPKKDISSSTASETPPLPSAVSADIDKNKESFRAWLIHSQHLAEHTAQNYASAINDCERLASQLGLAENRLYGADYATAQRFVNLLKQKTEYADENARQHNRYSASLNKYLLYLQSVSPTEAPVPSPPPEQQGDAFSSLFAEEKYKPLYEALQEDGITTLEALQELNLWSFMNLHQLYSIQQRLAISAEITAKLRNIGKENEETLASAYEIGYNGTVYQGASPSEAFVAFLSAAAVKYPLKFRSLLGVAHPQTGKVVVSRNCGEAKLRMMNPDAYVDAALSAEEVKLYIPWVIERCGTIAKEFSVKEPAPQVPEMPQVPETPEAPEVPEPPAEPPAVSPSLTQEAEDYLLQCDLTGAAYDELQRKLGCTMVKTKEVVAHSPRILEMNKRLFHVDALVDFEEGADTLEAVLDKLLKKNSGLATAKHLYEYARSDMTMFFNDNGIADQQSVYDLARHLFEKLGYHGKRYVFKSNTYISLPEVSADSNLGIMKKYALEKGTTVTFKEMEGHLNGLGLNGSNARGMMRIDKEPVFLVYAENEYLLAELMHIDAAFLEAVRSALQRLFADCGGHIVPRHISESWYKLLPALPASLPWTALLLQQLIRFYPNELKARTIIAMESQSSNTLHAMFVEADYWMQDFRDVVAFFLHEELPNQTEFEAEELRGVLVKAGLISGNQLIYHMPNALGDDPRFLWDGDGSRVKVRI